MSSSLQRHRPGLASLALAVIIGTVPGGAEPRVEPLVVGELVSFESAILSETRPLLVQAPPHVAPGTALDVLVVLDAETHGYHVSGLVDFLSGEYVELLPPTLVLGIPNTHRLRDTTPTATERWTEGGGVRAFIRFLVDEVLPWIDERHETSGRVTLVGHSGSGLAALYALLDAPETFDTILAVDPSADWDESVFLEDLQDAWPRRPSELPRLLVSSYREKDWQDPLRDALRRHGPRRFPWEFTLYEGETHNSMVHRAVHDGLRMAYAE